MQHRSEAEQPRPSAVLAWLRTTSGRSRWTDSHKRTLLTGAAVHDSQAAIPLMTMSGERVTYLYDLMDAAYDAMAIREHSLQLNYWPITDHPKHRRKVGEHKVPLRKNSRSWKRVIETETRAEE